MRHLSTLGFYTLSFDPPGTWESPGGIGLYSSDSYLKAIHEVIEHFGNRPTLVVGHSRGGTMAMLEGVANPSVAAVIAIMSSAAPVLDEEWERSGTIPFYRDLPPGDGPSAEQKRFDLPYDPVMGAANLLHDLHLCTKPKLFMLGLHDQSVPPGLVREAYRVAAEPKRLHELNAGHGYRYTKRIIDEVNQTITKFITEFDLA